MSNVFITVPKEYRTFQFFQQCSRRLYTINTMFWSITKTRMSRWSNLESVHETLRQDCGQSIDCLRRCTQERFSSSCQKWANRKYFFFIFLDTSFWQIFVGLCPNEQHPTNPRPIRKDLCIHGWKGLGTRCRATSQWTTVTFECSFRCASPDFCNEL